MVCRPLLRTRPSGVVLGLVLTLVVSSFQLVVCGPPRPQLSLNIKEGDFDNILDSLDPELSWSDFTQVGDVGIEYGGSVSATWTKEVSSILTPKAIWAKATKAVGGGWGVSTKAVVPCHRAMDSADVELSAFNNGMDLGLRLLGSAGEKQFAVKKLEVMKDFDVLGFKAGRKLSYFVMSKETEAVLAMEKGGTALEVTATLGPNKSFAKTASICQKLNENNSITPTISTDNKLSLRWDRSLPDGNRLISTYTPNENLNVKWKDGPWIANVDIPLDGMTVTGTNVKIKRELGF